MPIIPVVVEGDTDVVFFNQLAKLLSLPADISLEPRPAYGKGNIPIAVRPFLAPGMFSQVVVVEDINHRTPGQIVQSHRDSISAFLGQSVIDISESGEKFRVGDVTVSVIPMGLHDDPDLDALGITSHAMEDYLVKLLLSDESLRPEVPQLRELIEDLIRTIRDYGVTLDSSKDLFQLVKPIIKRGFSDTRVVRSLFENAAPGILRSVMAPILARLESAAGP